MQLQVELVLKNIVNVLKMVLKSIKFNLRIAVYTLNQKSALNQETKKKARCSQADFLEKYLERKEA